MRKRTLTSALVLAPTLVVGVAVAAGPATAAPARSKQIPHTMGAWTSKARAVGAPSKHRAVKAEVYLQPNGGLAALEADATARSTPGNALYHQYLTSAQYWAKFETPTATVDAVEAYLRSEGMRVTGVESHHRYISVRGSVASAEKAFGTTLKLYKHNGKTVQAPASNVTLPDSVAGLVSTVAGLDTSQMVMKPGVVYPAGFRNARPCSLAYGSIPAKTEADYKTKLPKFNGATLPYAVCGYTGPQLRAAYEGTLAGQANYGAGVTVAITDAYGSPSIRSDAETYATRHGDGSYAPGQYRQTLFKPWTKKNICGYNGWWGEQTLDVEAVHAMAPNAKIHYYGASNCYDSGLLQALGQAADDDQAKIVTNSWGDAGELGVTGGTIAAYEQIFLQGAEEGITYMFSSGDSGDELANTGLRQADFPASDPYVTGVGGTATAIAANGSLAWQTGWGTEKYALSANGKSWDPQGFIYGSGGGSSSLFNKPAYQSALSGGARQVPDLAMDADPTTGMLVGQTQQFSDGTYYGEYRIGGTSLASPLMAGLLALGVNLNNGTGYGLLNPLVYANANKKHFYDPKHNNNRLPDAGNVRPDFANYENPSDGVVYSVRTFDQDSSLVSKKGYDNVTGVGVPKPAFIRAISRS